MRLHRPIVFRKRPDLSLQSHSCEQHPRGIFAFDAILTKTTHTASAATDVTKFKPLGPQLTEHTSKLSAAPFFCSGVRVWFPAKSNTVGRVICREKEALLCRADRCHFEARRAGIPIAELIRQALRNRECAAPPNPAIEQNRARNCPVSLKHCTALSTAHGIAAASDGVAVVHTPLAYP
jgi:hypothetical protein